VSLFFTCWIPLLSQTLPFRTYTVDHGLAQSRAYCVMQDSKGYLWIGTQDGVSKFDGLNFHTYTTNEGLVNNRVLALMEDDRNNIWLGAAGGVSIFNESGYVNLTKSDGLAGDIVHDILQENDRSIWIATEGGLSNYIDGFFVNYTFHNGLPDSLIYSLYSDKKGAIWVGTANGYTIIKRDSVDVIHIGESVLSVPVMVFQEDLQGNMWIGTDGEGIYAIEPDGMKNYSIGNNKIYALYADFDSTMWIGTYGRGLYKHVNGSFINYSELNGLPNTVIRSIMKDREGNMWFGTYGGLALLRDEKIAYYTEDHGLTNNIVMAITKDHQDRYWFGTYGGGVTLYRSGEFNRFTTQNGLIHDAVRSIITDSEGAVWIGTHGGITRIKDNNITNYTTRNGLGGNIILSIYEDSRGNYWFGTFRDGISYMTDNKIETYTIADGLGHNTVRSIIEDNNGNLWFGTDHGLSLWHNGSFKNFTTDDGLAYDVIRSLTVDRSGKLWIATDGGGISVYDGNSFQKITTADGLSNNVCYFVLEDNLGHYWIGTNKGLNRYSPESEIFRIYTTHNGLPSNEMNTNAAYAEQDGTLWFGTVNGVVRLNTGLEKPNLVPPLVYVTKVSVFDEEYSVAHNLRLNHKENYLKFEFIGLNFTLPEKITYQYMLEGIDSDWQTSSARSVQYTSLSPGKYVFRVIAQNSEGILSDAPAEIYFNIIPPIWATWWFRALFVIIFTGVVLGLLYHSRVSTLTKERRKQEEFSKRLIDSQEQERKRIAAELHDSLGQNLLIIKNRALIGLSDAEFDSAGEQLQEISGLASQAINEVREISYNLRPYQLDRLGLKEAIESIIEKISNTTSIRCSAAVADLDQKLPKDVETNIYRIVQECLNNIVKHSQASEALVAVQLENNALILSIKDDGKGFVPDIDGTDSGNVTGFGLRGIAERVKILRGTLSIESSPGNGTKIIINIPMSLPNNG
jgi:ligand-binding sensor domain-containing protein/signal transduction histidine kinase